MKKLVGAVLLCLFLSTPIFAQTSNATVGGTVSDTTSALIPGVTITATHVATRIVTTVISNEAGGLSVCQPADGNLYDQCGATWFSVSDLQQCHTWGLAAGEVELHAGSGRGCAGG
jgi:hypothetical protein